MKKYKLLIVGASGLVGQKVIEILIEKSILECFNLTLVASDNSIGKSVIIKNKKYIYKKLSEDLIEQKFDYAIFSAGDEISSNWAPKFSQSGTVVIDNSNAFRREKAVPLIIPEINFNLIKKESKIIANPNCSTIEFVVVLEKLLKLADIELVVLTTMQAVSGAGKLALCDLENNTNNYFSKGINNNLISYIGSIDEFGICKEENKIIYETQKLLNKKLDIKVSTFRVPVKNCHTESVYIKFSKNVNIEDFMKSLTYDYIEIVDENFCVSDCNESDKTFVSRIRQVSEREYLFVIVADNLRRGAAYNAVEILYKLINLTEK